METKNFFIFTFCLLFFLAPPMLSISCRASISDIDLHKHFEASPAPPHQEGHKKRIVDSLPTTKEKKGKDISLGTDVVDESLPEKESSKEEFIPPSIIVPHQDFSVLSLPRDFSVKHFQMKENSPPNIEHIGEQYFTQKKISVKIPLSKFQTYLTVEIRSLFILERNILGKYLYPFFYYPSYLNPYYSEQRKERPDFLDEFLYPELQIYSRIRSLEFPIATSSIQSNQPSPAQEKM